MAGSGLIKHSLTIAGHATSISLEPVFWNALRAAAVAQDVPVAALVAEIDEARTTNLCSAIRVWLFEQALSNVGARLKATETIGNFG